MSIARLWYFTCRAWGTNSLSRVCSPLLSPPPRRKLTHMPPGSHPPAPRIGTHLAPAADAYSGAKELALRIVEMTVKKEAFA